MQSALLSKLVQYCNRTLKIRSVEDWPGAVNGLQLENNGKVTCMAAAVDATFSTAQKAVDQGADLLIVHHGLFWNKNHPWTGRRYAFIKFMLDHNLAVYSAHLPLDIHPELGNNSQLCKALEFSAPNPFSRTKGGNWVFDLSKP